MGNVYYILGDLLVGIIGGAFSSVIVSRIFLLNGELSDQFDALKKNMYSFGGLHAFFEVIEIILKTTSDYNDSPKKAMIKGLCKDKDPVIEEMDSLTKDLKNEIMDKSINIISNNENDYVFKEKEFAELNQKAHSLANDCKNIKELNFKVVGDTKKKISALEKEYNECFKKRSIYLWRLMIKDKLLIFLLITFLILCIMYIFFRLFNI